MELARDDELRVGDDRVPDAPRRARFVGFVLPLRRDADELAARRLDQCQDVAALLLLVRAQLHAGMAVSRRVGPGGVRTNARAGGVKAGGGGRGGRVGGWCV